MTRDEAITEAARIFAAACEQMDAQTPEQVAAAAYVPGGPHTIADLVDIVRDQRRAARDAAEAA